MESKKSKEIIIRRATSADHHAVAEILAEAFDVEAGCLTYWDNAMKDRNTLPFVVVAKGKIVATATLYIMEKLIHSGGKVGLIEDVAVSKAGRGYGLGKAIIDELVECARLLDCYKVILSCADHNVGFYAKCGFKKHEITMRKDLQ